MMKGAEEMTLTQPTSLSIGHFISYVCCLYSNYSNILAEMTTGCSLDS